MKGNMKWLLLLLGTGLIVIIGSILHVNSQLNAVDNSNIELIEIKIPNGSSPVEIANILKENNLIKNKNIFQMYAKYTGQDVHLKAGQYQFSKSMKVEDIIGKLVKGDTFVETIVFTIPEGYNIEQIANKLEKQGIINRSKFLQLVSQANFDYDFIKEIPNNNRLKYKLEGYLFPKTYEIKKEATEDEIINMMLSQFQKEWDEKWTEELKEKNLSLHEVVTLASIIEREVSVDKERKIVSGVLYNRLNNEWKLQVDATIQYILGKQRSIVTYQDLEINNPYNTYIYKGLPPGPIANPGIESIKAAIFPDKNDYFFYVTKKDNSGEHYFSKTYAEHKKNNRKSKGNT